MILVKCNHIITFYCSGTTFENRELAYYKKLTSPLMKRLRNIGGII